MSSLHVGLALGGVFGWFGLFGLVYTHLLDRDVPWVRNT